MTTALGSRRTVVIVGAGTSGLSAARWLCDHDVRNELNVIVLESKDRIGGRVHTIPKMCRYPGLSSSNDGLSFSMPIEAGAAWIHEHSLVNPISIIATERNMDICNTKWNDASLFDANGARYSVFSVLRNGLAYETAIDKIAERASTSVTSGSLEEAIAAGLSESRYQDCVMQTILSGVDFQYGTSLKNASPHVLDRDHVECGKYGDDGYNFNFCRDTTGYVGVLNSICDGTSPIPLSQGSEARVRRPLDVRLNHRVVGVVDHSREGPQMAEIQRNADGNITIEYLESNKTKSGECTPLRMVCDAVIITVPLGVLKAKSIEFTPPLSQQKQLAIDTAGFGNVVKIVLEFEDCFWSSINKEFIVICDNSISDDVTESVDDVGKAHQYSHRGMLTLFWNINYVCGRNILVGFGLGDAATLIDQMTDEAVMGVIRDRLSVIAKAASREGACCNRQAVSSSMPTKWYRTHWGTDPDVRGAYSYVPSSGPNIIQAGASTKTAENIFDVLYREESAYLHFAGEATMSSSLLRACVRGAWLSGVRAGESVAKSLGTLPTTMPVASDYPLFDTSRKQSSCLIM